MDVLLPDSEGAWICEKHKKERGHQRHGSNCYRCLQAKLEEQRKTTAKWAFEKGGEMANSYFKNKQLKEALNGLMWLEDSQPEWDDDENESPFEIARKLLKE